MTGQPINLVPIRAMVAAFTGARSVSTAGAVEFADWAARAIPDLCDEIHRLRDQITSAGPDHD